MRLLWIATKAPLPPVDGGRLVSWWTLRALAQAGLEIELIAPLRPGDDQQALAAALTPVAVAHLVPVRGTSFRATLRGLRPGSAWTLERHRHPALLRAVARHLAARRPDLVHVEQLQGFAAAAAARARGIPVLLRQQNVESELWRWRAPGDVLPVPPGLGAVAAALMRQEARRVARAEIRAVRSADRTLALTARDAGRLSQLAGVEVAALPAPFPSLLPAGPPLGGNPPVVLLGSGGWLPNRDAHRWFLDELWPAVTARAPGAHLHVFAPADELPPVPAAASYHPPPADSRAAFPDNGVLMVPLRAGSGVRMKILEAFARGVPVIATAAAAAGIEATPGREYFEVEEAAGIVAALRTLSEEPGRRQEMVRRARETLSRQHDPATVAARLLGHYRELVARPTPPKPLTAAPLR